MIFLDTNVVSETMRPQPEAAVVAWLKHNEDGLALSTVVIAEIAFGIERIRPAERAVRLDHTLKSWRTRLANRIIEFDEESALIYGNLCGEKSRGGETMETIDGMIAAISLRHKAALATRNTKHFEGLGLRLINPWQN